MIPGVIARRYANALLELGSESGQLNELVDEVSRASEAYESNEELRGAFENPLLPLVAKKQIVADVSELLGLHVTARSFLGILVDRRRIRALPAVAARLSEMADLKRGITRAEVSTAMPLPDAFFEQLQSELSRMTGRSVALDRKVVPSLVCGVLIRIGDTIYDGTLTARLNQLKETLLPD